MGFLDKLQSLFKIEKADLNLRFDLLTEGLAGTMSKFHRARDRKHNRTVGLKILDPEKLAVFEARFPGLKKPSEGQIAKALSHERIVETFEHGVSVKGEHYIVMEYLTGPGLHVLIRQRDERLDGKHLTLIRQMAEAVLAVHEAGYIHRDICPRNFICSDDIESLKLIDFGLSVPDEAPYRQPGNRTGTPMYMAPEIVRRRTTDRRVDIFAFGVTAYELLTYQLPWPDAEATGRGALSHDTVSPVPLSEVRPNINRFLANAVTDCLAPRADDRPRTMDVFLRRIRSVRAEEE